MSDPTDADRRERAEKWLDTNEVPTQDDDDWASNHTAHEIGWAQLIGYLAGAREEAAIKDKEAHKVGKDLFECELENVGLQERLFKASNRFEELNAEIATLRADNASLREANEIDLGEKGPLIDQIVDLRAEIAALREAVRELVFLEYDGELRTSQHGDEIVIGLTDRSERAVRRALEEKL